MATIAARGSAGSLIGVLKAMPWVVVAISALVACDFVVVRGEDLNWDLLNYHYYSGYALVNGRFADDVAPSGLQTLPASATQMF